MAVRTYAAAFEIDVNLVVDVAAQTMPSAAPFIQVKVPLQETIRIVRTSRKHF
jgi:hypothetical protein